MQLEQAQELQLPLQQLQVQGLILLVVVDIKVDGYREFSVK